jgi:hypothetical protein
LAQLEILTPEGKWLRADLPAEATIEYLSPAISELRAKLGEEQTVDFRVQGTGGRSHLFINSKGNFLDSDCFTAVVEPDQVPAFSSRGLSDPAAELIGKTVRVTGTVVINERNVDQIQIRISDLARQLQIIDPSDWRETNQGEN